jgi:hypothetical protein
MARITLPPPDVPGSKATVSAANSRLSDVGQALLRSEFAELYPGIQPNVWQPAAVMIDLVVGLHRNGRQRGQPNRDRVLNTRHFTFREVASTASHEARQQRRREQREDESEEL